MNNIIILLWNQNNDDDEKKEDPNESMSTEMWFGISIYYDYHELWIMRVLAGVKLSDEYHVISYDRK